MLSGYYENYWSILKLYDSTTVPMLINKLIQQLFSNYYQLLNQFICSTPQNTHFFFKKNTNSIVLIICKLLPPF